MSKKKKDLEKIPSKLISRSFSLLNLTVKSGSKFAGQKLSNLFANKEEQEKNFDQYLKSQAKYLVEELGNLKGSIMKAGQMLSVYGEHFFPEQVNEILKNLQSNSRPVTWKQMEKVIISQLGDKLYEELEVDPKPVAAASMGQVYKAKIKKSGDILALKVQYPGVDKAIDSDLNFLKKILSMSHFIPSGGGFDEVFKEVKMMLHHEVDYQREQKIIELYRTKLAGDPRFIIPKTYARYSTKRLLAMSYEDGCPIDSSQVLALSEVRRNKICAALMDLMFKEIFEWRMVQTDPHFGNYRIRLSEESDDQDKIILFDFGAVRLFSKRYIDLFASLVKSAIDLDPYENFNAGCNIGFLKLEDTTEVRELFNKICFMAIEGFSQEYASPKVDGSVAGDNPYCWAEEKLLERLSVLAKDAIFTFKLRPPPREAIFLDRKMVGTYTVLAKLGLKMGARDLLLHYLAVNSKSKS